MKLKKDFVTNSSSTGFIIINTSDKELTLVDFVSENSHLIEDFKEQYLYRGDPRYTQKGLIISAIENNITFKPGEHKECVFGDEDGTLIGQIFDYILRDGGKSKNFEWHFNEYYR